MNRKEKSTSTSWNDPDDAPLLTEEWFEGAWQHDGGKVVKRGRGRPPLENPKQAVKIRYDHDVIEAFRESGAGWQTRMNDALRVFLKEHDPKELDQR